jgi:hypothetical protein
MMHDEEMKQKRLVLEKAGSASNQIDAATDKKGEVQWIGTSLGNLAPCSAKGAESFTKIQLRICISAGKC